jgi:hypothetical protein
MISWMLSVPRVGTAAADPLGTTVERGGTMTAASEVTLSERLAHPVLNGTVTFPVLNGGQPGADRPSLATAAYTCNTSYA